jgi:hypothetical protein
MTKMSNTKNTDTNFSLHAIEKVLHRLWTEEDYRKTAFTKRSPSKTTQPAIIDAQLLKQIDRQGIELYSGLLNYGLQDLMVSIYPGCAELIGDAWEETVDDYFKHFPSRHYHLNSIAKQFPEYLARHAQKYERKYPYLVELADYEWLELEVMEMDIKINESNFVPLDSPEAFGSIRPIINPVLILRKFNYDLPCLVDAINAEESLSKYKKPTPCSVAIFRDPQTHICKFLKLGDMAAYVIEQARSQSVTYKDLLANVFTKVGTSNVEQCIVDFLELIETLQDERVFIGSIKETG